VKRRAAADVNHVCLRRLVPAPVPRGRAATGDSDAIDRLRSGMFNARTITRGILMKLRIRHALAAALLAPALLMAQSAPGEAKDGRNAAAIIGGIAGLAVGAAIADNANRNYDVYGAPPPPSYRPPAPFSPSGGIICYPDQRACYNNGGAYNSNWTWRVYGR
jgi:hypothetical protein